MRVQHYETKMNFERNHKKSMKWNLSKADNYEESWQPRGKSASTTQRLCSWDFDQKKYSTFLSKNFWLLCVKVAWTNCFPGKSNEFHQRIRLLEAYLTRRSLIRCSLMILVKLRKMIVLTLRHGYLWHKARHTERQLVLTKIISHYDVM